MAIFIPKKPEENKPLDYLYHIIFGYIRQAETDDFPLLHQREIGRKIVNNAKESVCRFPPSIV